MCGWMPDYLQDLIIHPTIDSCVDRRRHSLYIDSLTSVLKRRTTPQPQPQPFYGPFSRTTRVSRCQKRNFWTLWCKGRLTEADTLTIRLDATPTGLTSAHLHHPYPPQTKKKNTKKTLKLSKCTDTTTIQRQAFHRHYTGQPVLAGTPTKSCRILLELFYCLHSLADSNKHI